MEKLVISACLLGINCKYNGSNNYNPLVEDLKKKYELIIICPEELGGLSTPRIPSEILNDKIINKEGIDVTKEFTLGAKKAKELANGSKLALLKDGSPSCGSTYIYDGTFQGKKINGMGVTAKLLTEENIKIYNEKNISELMSL